MSTVQPPVFIVPSAYSHLSGIQYTKCSNLQAQVWIYMCPRHRAQSCVCLSTACVFISLKALKPRLKSKQFAQKYTTWNKQSHVHVSHLCGFLHEAKASPYNSVGCCLQITGSTWHIWGGWSVFFAHPWETLLWSENRVKRKQAHKNKGRGRTGALATKEINYSPHFFFFPPAFYWISFEQGKYSSFNFNVTLLFSNWNLFEMCTDESGILITQIHKKKYLIAWSNISFLKKSLVSKRILLPTSVP